MRFFVGSGLNLLQRRLRVEASRPSPLSPPRRVSGAITGTRTRARARGRAREQADGCRPMQMRGSSCWPPSSNHRGVAIDSHRALIPFLRQRERVEEAPSAGIERRTAVRSGLQRLRRLRVRQLIIIPRGMPPRPHWPCLVGPGTAPPRTLL